MKLIIGLCLICTAFAVPVFKIRNTSKNVARLANLGPNDLAEELSGQFEGDIVLNADQERILSSRTGLILERYRWINNEVPYEIDVNTFHADQVIHIVEGLRSIEAVSCIRFVPYNSQIHTDFISVIGSGSGCWSMVGRQGGRQELHLQLYPVEQGCFRLGTIIHEFIHALGFYHMQSASERDEYVEIVWENIESGTENNFAIQPVTSVTNFGVEYDYGSVMHYGPTAFSVNGQKTIIPILDPTAPIGQRIGMSAGDIERINRMYNCPAK